MQPLFRQYLPKDLPEIVSIEQRAFADPWCEEAFTGLMQDCNWVLELDKKVIGYILYHTVLDEAIIINFAIDPTQRGNHYGDLLLKNSLQCFLDRGVTKFYLDVRQSNEIAIALYRKHGFVEMGIRPGYYHKPPENAIVMGKILS